MDYVTPNADSLSRKPAVVAPVNLHYATCMSNKAWTTQLPMWATNVRMAGGLLLVLLLMSSWPHAAFVAAILFIFFSFTDWLDGYWARRYNCETNMGKLMDPIADKILVLGTLLMLLERGLVDPLMVFLLLSRDLFIGGIRSVAAADQLIIAAKPFGKWKTALQMVAIPCLLVDRVDNFLPTGILGYYLLWVSVGLSLLSGAQYTRHYLKARKTAH